MNGNIEIDFSGKTLTVKLFGLLFAGLDNYEVCGTKDKVTVSLTASVEDPKKWGVSIPPHSFS